MDPGRTAVAGRPRGWHTVWSTLGASTLALVVFQAVHHRPAQGIEAAPPSPSTTTAPIAPSTPVTRSTAPSPPTLPDTTAPMLPASAGRPSTLPRKTRPPARPKPTSTPRPAPSNPGPSAPSPILMAGVTIALPARSTPLLAVRAALVAPAAPPFPTVAVDVTLLGLRAAITLP